MKMIAAPCNHRLIVANSIADLLIRYRVKNATNIRRLANWNRNWVRVVQTVQIESNADHIWTK